MIRYKDFADLVDRMAASSPDKAALLACGEDGLPRAVTWADLAKRVHARTEEIALGGRTCKAVLADGTPECIVEVFAAVRAGLQVALIDPLMPDRVIAPLLPSIDADCVWASDGNRAAGLEKGLVSHRACACGAHAMLFFTSGTTSASKAVVLTDASLMASAFNGSSLMPLSPADTLLCLLPLAHVFGFVCGLLWGLSCGGTVALGRGARHYVDDFATFKPTAVAVVPKLLGFLESRSAFNAELSLVLVGAADCDDALLDGVRKRGIRASLGYGLTETSSGVALSIGDDFHAMTVCPDDEVAIAEDGEVLLRTPTCLMQGYYRDAEKTASAIRDGWLHTGDKGFLDGDGLLHVQGRLKDVLTLPGGTKVFLPDYESALSHALQENDIAVVLHDGKLTLVCGRVAHELTEGEIMRATEAALAAYPPTSRIGAIAHLGHALPRTAAGDIERWKILEEMKHDDR